MKKTLLILGLAFAMFSCQKEEKKETFKTAYINTSEVLEKYDKFKDEDEKFTVKSQEMGRPLEAKLKAFKKDASNFQRNAQIKGMAWAQRKGAELQQREQELAMEQDALLRQIQTESDSIRKELVDAVKDYIKKYGEKRGYDYIYGTGDIATILYAKEGYDITKDVLKELNDNFKKEQESNKAEEKSTEESAVTEK